MGELYKTDQTSLLWPDTVWSNFAKECAKTSSHLFHPPDGRSGGFFLMVKVAVN